MQHQDVLSNLHLWYQLPHLQSILQQSQNMELLFSSTQKSYLIVSLHKGFLHRWYCAIVGTAQVIVLSLQGLIGWNSGVCGEQRAFQVEAHAAFLCRWGPLVRGDDRCLRSGAAHSHGSPGSNVRTAKSKESHRNAYDNQLHSVLHSRLDKTAHSIPLPNFISEEYLELQGE